MNPEFEKKMLQEYLSIVQSPEKKAASYRRWKYILWGFTIVLCALLYFSKAWLACNTEARISLALATGAIFIGAFVVSYSLAQQPLIAKYMDADAMEERLKDLNA